MAATKEQHLVESQRVFRSLLDVYGNDFSAMLAKINSSFEGKRAEQIKALFSNHITHLGKAFRMDSIAEQAKKVEKASADRRAVVLTQEYYDTIGDPGGAVRDPNVSPAQRSMLREILTERIAAAKKADIEKAQGIQYRMLEQGNKTGQGFEELWANLTTEQQAVMARAGGGKTMSATRKALEGTAACLLYTSPSPRDRQKSRMPSSA